MEYATRDQAQHAVNTLSNQNLMGRLVYVREVRVDTVPSLNFWGYTGTDFLSRTAKQSLVSALNNNQGHHMGAQEALVPAIKVVDLEVVWAEVPVPGQAVKSMYPTLVFLHLLTVLTQVTDRFCSASIHCWVAGSEGFVSSSWYISTPFALRCFTSFPYSQMTC